MRESVPKSVKIEGVKLKFQKNGLRILKALKFLVYLFHLDWRRFHMYQASILRPMVFLQHRCHHLCCRMTSHHERSA